MQRRVRLAVAGISVMGVAGLFSTGLSGAVLHSFSAGQVANPDQVNANFAALNDAINAGAGDLAATLTSGNDASGQDMVDVGKIGIGIDAPGGPLHMRSDNSTYSIQLNGQAYVATNNWGSRIFTQDCYGGLGCGGMPLVVQVQDDTTWRDAAYFSHGGTATHPSLRTYNNTYLATNGGNVGIGTTTATTKLHVDGDTRLGLVTTGSAEPAGYGARLFFSGGPVMGGPYDSDNSDEISIARYNSGSDETQLRFSVGDFSDTNDFFAFGDSSNPEIVKIRATGFIESVRSSILAVDPRLYLVDSDHDDWYLRANAGDLDFVGGDGPTTTTMSLSSSGDVNVAGTVTATAFSGDGSGLSNLPGLAGTLTTGNDASGQDLVGVGSLGIGTTAPIAPLVVQGSVLKEHGVFTNGHITCSGGVTESSGKWKCTTPRVQRATDISSARVEDGAAQRRAICWALGAKADNGSASVTTTATSGSHMSFSGSSWSSSASSYTRLDTIDCTP